MRLVNAGSNQTIVKVGDQDSGEWQVLFSYSTPVAAVQSSREKYATYRTETKHSATTSRHINAFVSKAAEVKPQEFFDNLLTVTVNG